MRRRTFLAASSAFGLAGTSAPSAEVAEAPASAPKITITLNGATFIYPNGPKIPAYHVDIRRDGRIIFHLGELGDLKSQDRIPPYDLGPHHVKIERGGSVLLEAELPSHWWNSEWTHRLSPMRRALTPAQIVKANRMFRYGDTGARVPAQPNYTFKGAMDSAGITQYMPTTGERGDIGLITDCSGYYMLGASPGPMVAWALAAGSIPMHFRDETTGKPIDLTQYPAANASDLPGLQGAPFLSKGMPDKRAPVYTQYGGGWTPQQAHYPELSYLAHYATGDLGFLEDLQYSANFTVLCDGYLSAERRVATVHGEYRGVAWALRNLFMAHVATQDAEAAGVLPEGCHPSVYWKTLLDNQLSYYSKFMIDPSNQFFRLINGEKRFGPWQVDYALCVLAFAVLTGHSDWKAFYLWALGNAIARTNGTSGYPPGYGGAYYLNTGPLVMGKDGKYTDQVDPTKASFTSWSDCFLEQAKDPTAELVSNQIETLKKDPFNGGHAMIGHEYLMTTRAVLVMAAFLEEQGLASVRSEYPELDKCIATVDRMVRANGAINPRVSLIL